MGKGCIAIKTKLLTTDAFDKLFAEIGATSLVERPAQRRVFAGIESYFLLGSYHNEPIYKLEDAGYTYVLIVGDVLVYREPCRERIPYGRKILESKEQFVIPRDLRTENSI